MISETTIYLYMYTLLMCDHIFETVQEVEYMYQYIVASDIMRSSYCC